MAGRGRDAMVMGLLALLPVLAHAPAWWEGRLLGPADGAALHYPLRAQVWDSYRRGEIPSWNPTIFLGTPLLASYRPGAFFPPMAALSFAPSFPAFQVLVLFCLSASAVLVFLYLRRLGADTVGAYFSGLSFSLGPYLVGHVGDTATVVASPTLPLILLAAESHMNRGTPARAAGLAVSFALLLLAGSPEAVRAGAALLAGRLLVGHLFPAGAGGPDVRASGLAVLAGALLAAPQILPTLLVAPEAGRQVSGLAGGGEALPGATGLVLRYVSHTPAPSLALAALPLTLTQTPVRVLGVALALCVALQWGRGPLAAPGALALVFDLTLCILAGLSLSAQWRARRDAWGRRLRAYFLFACLASAAALSVSAAALGPLPQTLAGSVGVLALAMILYFSLAPSPALVKAGLWLLPLTVSFLLQPHGRRIWDDAPTREEMYEGTLTKQAIDRVMGPRRGERLLTLVREWPREQAGDLGYANLGALGGRRTANGYDPMVPLRNRMALGAMGPGGALPGAFFRSDPRRLEVLGIRWVQVPSSALAAPADPRGLGDPVDLAVEFGRPRFFPLPISAATEVRLASSMSDAVLVPQGQVVAFVNVRLASGREIPLVARAGEQTGEWAYDRPDVRPLMAHRRPLVLESWPGPEGSFEGHRYLGTLALPGRYHVDGIWVERAPGGGRLHLFRLALRDGASGRPTPVSLLAGYVSDTARFREAAATPAVRLFEVPGAMGQARVVEGFRILPDDEAVLLALRSWPAIDPRREVLARAEDVRDLALPEGSRSSRAEVVRAVGARLDVRAEGPGLLVVAEGWDPGWRATVDGRPSRLLRVNHVQMAVPLPAGTHRVALRHRARGLFAGAAMAAAAAVGLLVWWWRG